MWSRMPSHDVTWMRAPSMGFDFLVCMMSPMKELRNPCVDSGVIFIRHGDTRWCRSLCAICNKTDHLHLAGLLQPLPVPTSVWSDISMDFVERTPKVSGKFVILTDVDRFSKYVIALSHPYSVESMAMAFFREMVRLHGVPTSIVSDRDPVFTFAFWAALFSQFGTKLHVSSAFHPQSDGQSEAVNKEIGMYLRCMTEFVYNTAYHSALKESPFEVVYESQWTGLIVLRRPSDRLEVDDEDLDGLRQKPSNGPEAMLGVSRPWELGTRRGGSATVV
ncbi:hypothetical protein U9M48_031130 [Paspalum notatum var. saurae]|uniref:Integrase catalytic domain-containing protein n=1 Tax=Paspalum notatum var. saurae TaxID=547442 RepID=A0AAQ3U4E6_PASNO